MQAAYTGFETTSYLGHRPVKLKPLDKKSVSNEETPIVDSNEISIAMDYTSSNHVVTRGGKLSPIPDSSFSTTAMELVSFPSGLDDLSVIASSENFNSKIIQ